MRKPLAALTLAAAIVTAALRVSAQQSDQVTAWLDRVNQVRFDEGLAPYAFSRQLAAAAQRHADDVAANGFTNPGDVHMGSDGTHEQQRAAEAGYSAWTWNSGELIVDENMWSGQGTIDDAMGFFLGSTLHRNNLLSSRYREIGIGVTIGADERSYYVLVFGVRPNVLPISINDGATNTDNPQVAIRLTNEEARPDGQGVDLMGEAIEVRVSGAPDLEGAEWVAWDTYVSWTLPDGPGEYVVYVQFRDAAGRTALSQDSIVLGEGAPTTETPLPSTPEPTATPVPPTATPSPTATPVPTDTPAPTVPPTPEPIPTGVAPTPTPALPPTSPPDVTSVPVAVTLFPTWTPLPTATPAPAEGPDVPWGLIVLLQGAALVFGIYLALRRGV